MVLKDTNTDKVRRNFLQPGLTKLLSSEELATLLKSVPFSDCQPTCSISHHLLLRMSLHKWELDGIRSVSSLEPGEDVEVQPRTWFARHS